MIKFAVDTISTADRCLLLLRSIQSTLHLQLIDRFMRSSKTIHIVSRHAKRDVGDVIVGAAGLQAERYLGVG